LHLHILPSTNLKFKVAHLQQMPNRTAEDNEAIATLLNAMKGGAEAERQRGTLLNYVAALSHHVANPQPCGVFTYSLTSENLILTS